MTRRWKPPLPKSPQIGLRYLPVKTSPTDTSLAAASSVGAAIDAVMGAVRSARRDQSQRGVLLANTVRKEVLAYLEANREGATADELAIALRRSPFTTRPRCTELQKMGLIRDSGARRKNFSGRNAIVWTRG